MLQFQVLQRATSVINFVVRAGRKDIHALEISVGYTANDTHTRICRCWGTSHLPSYVVREDAIGYAWEFVSR